MISMVASSKRLRISLFPTVKTDEPFGQSTDCPSTSQTCVGKSACNTLNSEYLNTSCTITKTWLTYRSLIRSCFQQPPIGCRLPQRTFAQPLLEGLKNCMPSTMPFFSDWRHEMSELNWIRFQLAPSSFWKVQAVGSTWFHEPLSSARILLRTNRRKYWRLDLSCWPRW